MVHEGEEEVMEEEDTVRAADADEEESGRSRWQGQDAGEEVGETERPKRPATMMEGVRAAREKMKREKEAKEEEVTLPSRRLAEALCSACSAMPGTEIASAAARRA